MIAFPIFLGIAALSSEIILQLYGVPWAASIPVLQLVMLIGVVRSAMYIYSSVFRAAGKPSWRFWAYLLTAALNVIGFVVVVRLGIVAVAASYVIVSYLLMPLYFFMIRNLIGVSIRSHLSQFGPAIVGSLVMFAIIYAQVAYWRANPVADTSVYPWAHRGGNLSADAAIDLSTGIQANDGRRSISMGRNSRGSRELSWINRRTSKCL